MDLIGQDRQWTVGRKLMQVNDSLTSEDAGPRSSKNCTEPGKMVAALGASRRGPGCRSLWWKPRKSWMLCFSFEF